jgi:hypothetical protein
MGSRVEDFKASLLANTSDIDDDIVQYLCSIIESDVEITADDFSAIAAPFLVEAGTNSNF